MGDQRIQLHEVLLLERRQINRCVEVVVVRDLDALAVGAEEGAGVQEPWDPTVLEGSLHERGEREPACAIDVAAVPTGLVWRESGRRHVRFRQGARLPAGVIRSLMVSRSGCRKLQSRRRAERAAGCWM